jgi:gliding motility-associated-like protein
MTGKWLLPIIFLFLLFDLKADVPVEIRRICKSGRDNYIYFYPSTDPCALYFQYKIWGRNGLVGSYSLIDSISVKNTDQYIHVEANPGVATNWSYFIVITDSCGPDYETISDTVIVDEQAPSFTFIDSASVDPLTNKVSIGWSSNLSPDFYYYILYKDSLGTNVPILSNSKDTFHIDIRPSSNPVLQPIKYDISAVDSCGNAKIFTINPHTTIWLRNSVDTCEQKANLTWSPYIGWINVKKYYIYRKTGSGPYLLIDSANSPTGYSDIITLGLNYSYYIRAFKDTSISISSSSNSIDISTRFRVEPTASYISSLSVSSSDQDVFVKIFNPLQEVRKYELFGSSELAGFYSLVSSINASPSVSEYETSIPLSKNTKYIQARAMNGCNESFPSTNISRYIELQASSQNEQNDLIWDPYFTWNVGVNYYRIYRGTNDNSGSILYSLIDSVPGIDSVYHDLSLPEIVGENGLCYYVEAIQNSGDVNGSIETAASTHACIVGELKVFIPNAFRPDGFNRTFRPEGSYIDYDNSSMDIYDRWGAKLIGIQNIRDGWNGKDSAGIQCTQGVYYYKIFIKSTNGKEKIYTGFVTLIN